MAKAYVGETYLTSISLKEESFTKYAGATGLGGSFRNNPEASPSSSWNLEEFENAMPTKIVIEYSLEDGKTYTFMKDSIVWIDEGYSALSISEEEPSII